MLEEELMPVLDRLLRGVEEIDTALEVEQQADIAQLQSHGQMAVMQR